MVVHPDPETLALATATMIVEEARRAVAQRGRFTVALSGGSTPRRAYELLASSPFAGLVPWEHVHVYWADERCVDPADSLSNERMAREALLNHVPIPPDQMHPMRCRCGPTSAHRLSRSQSGVIAQCAAAEYDALVRAHFPKAGMALDLVLLGLGRDGHTASLFAGSEVLEEKERRVAAVFTEGTAGVGPNGAGQGLWRVTLTAPFINEAAMVVFLVSGSSKAEIVREVIEGETEPSRLPAQLIRPMSGRLHWYLDNEAAALLGCPEGAG